MKSTFRNYVESLVASFESKTIQDFKTVTVYSDSRKHGKERRFKWNFKVSEETVKRLNEKLTKEFSGIVLKVSRLNRDKYSVFGDWNNEKLCIYTTKKMKDIVVDIDVDPNKILTRKLKEELKKRAVRFTYLKKYTGELRTAVGTLNREVIRSFSVTDNDNVNYRKQAGNVQVYFDLEKMAWRSFDTTKLVNVVFIN